MPAIYQSAARHREEDRDADVIAYEPLGEERLNGRKNIAHRDGYRVMSDSVAH